MRRMIKLFFNSGMIKKVKYLNLRPTTEISKIDPDLRYKINQSFKPNLKKLEKLIRRDLSMWYGPEGKRSAKQI